MPNDGINSAQPYSDPEATYGANRTSPYSSDTDTGSEDENEEIDNFMQTIIADSIADLDYSIDGNNDIEMYRDHWREMVRLNANNEPSSRFYVSWNESDSDDTINLSSSEVNSDGKGLTFDRILKFTTFNADQKTVDKGCAICLDDVEMNKLMIRLDCNHVYCSECISKWFEKHVTCPECRRKFSN